MQKDWKVGRGKQIPTELKMEGYRLRGAQRVCCRDGGQSKGQETVANPLLDEPHPHPIPYSSTELKGGNLTPCTVLEFNENVHSLCVRVSSLTLQAAADLASLGLSLPKDSHNTHQYW